MKPRRNSRHRWVDYYYLISVGKSTKNNWNRQKKMGKFWNKWLFYVVEHKNMGWGMKRKEKEWFWGINRNQSESIGKWPGMTGKTTELRADYDRKRPSAPPHQGMDSSEIPRFSLHFPRFFTYFPRFSVKNPYICIVFHFNRIIYYKVWKKKISLWI